MIATRLGLALMGTIWLVGTVQAQNQLQWIAAEDLSAARAPTHPHRQLTVPPPNAVPGSGVIQMRIGDRDHLAAQHDDSDYPTIHAPANDTDTELGWHQEDAYEVELEAATTAGCACGQKQCPGVCTDPGRPKKPKKTKPGDRDWGDCPPYRYRIPDCERAGNPRCVAKWAQCSVTEKYSAWFVGGGAAFFRGRCRKPTEGTWGLDYDGYLGHVNNWLTYTRGRKQGGEGAYETDGEPEFVSRAHELLGIGHE